MINIDNTDKYNVRRNSYHSPSNNINAIATLKHYLDIVLGTL